MNGELRSNLLRLWLFLAQRDRPRARAEEIRLAAALQRLVDSPLRTAEGLVFSDTSPEAALISSTLPGGLPGFEHLTSAIPHEIPPDLRRLASSLIVGESRGIRETIETALRLAPTSVPVLISGETGTGKDLVAQLIHSASARSKRPMVTLNCAAVPESLITAELFGYEPGAFTGAAPRGLQGKVEAADGGTLFLDEIAELSPAGQAALLRFLDCGEVQKIGRSFPRRVDVRLICATNRDLAQRCADGSFRTELYYRVALLPIHVPPLRDRKGDIPLLVSHFLEEFRRRHHREHPSAVSVEAMRCLVEHVWPGNVRELMFTLERAFLVCREASIDGFSLTAAPITPLSSGTIADFVRQRMAGSLPAWARDREPWVAFLIGHLGKPFSAAEVVREFRISEASARLRLSALVRANLLRATGAKKGRRYAVVESYDQNDHRGEESGNQV